MNMFRAVLGLSLTFSIMGCGSGATTCTVSGKVTSGGKPLICGDVHVYDAKGEFKSGGIDTEGNYIIFDAPMGEVKVAVVSNKPQPPPPVKAEAPPTGAPPPPDPTKWFAIAAKYSDPNTSGKTMTLNAGKNQQDIVLD